MKLWTALTANYYINVAIIAWFTAQVVKVILTLFSTNRVEMERFVGSGGMPSSHAAFTVSVAVAIARKIGISSPEFALAFVFASVVMYDAMGVRRAAGEQAKVLNRMLFEFSDFPRFLLRNQGKIVNVDLDSLEDMEQGQEENGEEADSGRPDKELKEFLGHTPLEVVGGCLWGIMVALFIPVH